MAEFRLRKDAEDWFKHIGDRAPFKTKFDRYYLCLMVGLAARRPSNPTEGGVQAPEFVQRFVEDYRGYELLVLGLLLRAELARLGFSLDERDEVRTTLAELVEPQGLSAAAIAKLNEYASGGFEVLLERYGAAPYSAEEFLPRYATLMSELVEAETTWSP